MRQARAHEGGHGDLTGRSGPAGHGSLAGHGGLGRRLGGVLLGTLLATLVAWSPPVVRPAFAAGPLAVKADTRYTVDTDAGRVHVAIEYTVTNNKPNTPTIIYYYRDLTFGIQPDVRQVRASDGSGSLNVSTRKRDGYTEVDVRLRANLYYRRSTTFTLRYDLVGGAPRSEAPIRVGKAFVSFGVWAFGDANKGTVEVRVPGGFTHEVAGDELPQVSGGVGSGAVLRTKPAVPDEFFAIVDMERPGAYEKTRLDIEGGTIRIVVLAWPEDPEWARAVATTMERGVVRLVDLIGIEWPIFRDLNVTERYTPLLEGYAGFFLSDSQRIEMIEDLDEHTTLHELSHVWFNQNFFQERWITEGLAEVYAYRVGEAIGVPSEPPVEPEADDEGFVRLNVWVFPTVERDDTDAKELYGYRTSRWLMDRIVEAAGVDQMREAFQAANENLTAYPGIGEPEHVGIRDDWKRLLDLTQPIDQPDPEEVIGLFEQWVVAPGDAGRLDDRTEARDAYRALVEAGDGWLPPWYVRKPMGEWQFDDATERIAEATAALALVDQVKAAATAEGLAFDDAAMRTAYESTGDGFEAITTMANDQLAAIAAITAARPKVEAAPDFVAQVGLMGETLPSVPYEAARAAFEAGDLAAVSTNTAAAIAAVDRAPVLGQERLVLGGGIGTGVLLLLLLAVFLLVRRRGRRRRAALASTASIAALDARFSMEAPAVEPASVAPEPSGTLGADPDGPASPIGEAPPATEGGPTQT